MNRGIRHACEESCFKNRLRNFGVADPVAVMAQNAPDVRSKIAALEQQVKKYLEKQKPQFAIPLLEEIVKLDAKNLNAQANLGVLLFFQNNYTDAIPHMRTALELQPDLWRIEVLLGMAEKRTGDPREAQKNLERAFPNLDDTKIQIDAGLKLPAVPSVCQALMPISACEISGSAFPNRKRAH